MKKLVFMLMLSMFAVASQAQTDVTKFLGIPVDGSKSEMIQKLKAKGFKYNAQSDELTGEFNGKQVGLAVQTNNNKVYRIVVMNSNYVDEGQIKIEYNKLSQQFQNNKKYYAIESSDLNLSEEEDISYQMGIKNKKYQAAFLQLSSNNAFADESEIKKCSNKLVWFTIGQYLRRYTITIFYENLNNAANGDDL